MPLARDKESVAIRRQVICDTLAAHPWSTARMVKDFVLEETGGRPTILTGALYIPPHTISDDLRALERKGRVQRRQFSARSTLWAVT